MMSRRLFEFTMFAFKAKRLVAGYVLPLRRELFLGLHPRIDMNLYYMTSVDAL